MKNRFSKVITSILLIAVLMLPGVQMASAKTESTTVPYSYNYDAWGDERESPNPYTPVRMITGNDIGVGNFSGPQDLHSANGNIYIVDTGNNRIVECDSKRELVRVIDHVMIDGARSEFNSPHGVFVTHLGDIYIADTSNQRIIHTDYDLNVIKIITKPPDALIDDISEFLPLKIAVDEGDRIFLLGRNVNKGIMTFDGEGVFAGYIGANKVRFNVIDLLWKRVFSTRAQREQMAAFVPTEFSNIAIDHQGFLYTTCSNLSGSDVRNLINESGSGNFLTQIFGLSDTSDIQPVKRLNATGADVLIRNGWLPPIGDWNWADVGGIIRGPSKFVDIVPFVNDSYFALDSTRGRVFAYDFQGNLLYIFGGYGNKLGYFTNPVAIDIQGSDILVLDSRSAAFTVFEPTQYGLLIERALTEYKVGNYELSAELWERVLVMNANYDLAYIGIGRALLRQDRFEEAMEYFKLKYDFDNYSKAFEQQRRITVERNIPYVITIIIALIVINAVYKRRRYIKQFIAWLKSKRSGAVSDQSGS